jgi:hypothetical protein
MLTIKKRQWTDIGRAKMSLEKRRMLEGEVNRLRCLTGIGVLRLALFTGVGVKTWRERHIPFPRSFASSTLNTPASNVRYPHHRVKPLFNVIPQL